MSEIRVDKIQGTSGTATALTLDGANSTVNGTLSVTGVHTIGNNAVVTSEGGAVTQNTVQGLIKHWISMNGTGTIAIQDSFNASAIADMGGGDYVITVSNNLANDDYTLAFNQLADVTPAESCFVGLRAGGTVTTKSTSQYRGLSVDQGGAVEDNVDFGCMIAGDLA